MAARSTTTTAHLTEDDHQAIYDAGQLAEMDGQLLREYYFGEGKGTMSAARRLLVDDLRESVDKLLAIIERLDEG